MPRAQAGMAPPCGSDDKAAEARTPPAARARPEAGLRSTSPNLQPAYGTA
jgi:hypothetical protein